MSYHGDSVPLRCLVGFKITSDIKISVNGAMIGVMETIQQGAE